MIHPDRFSGQVMVVTGAAQGIGRGVALAAAREGARLVLADRSPLVHEVAQEARTAGARSVVCEVDLETWAGARALAERALADWGRIDILINNVGGTIWAMPYEAYEDTQIEAEIRRSLFPTLWCCRAVLPAMIAARAGSIVNVSSVATRGIYRVPYSAAKGGVNALTASLAMEHAQDGIRVNAVATGGTEAPPRMVPRNPDPPSDREQAWYQGIVDQTTASSLMRRYGTIAEQVAAILFLASGEASYITGTVLPVGGATRGDAMNFIQVDDVRLHVRTHGDPARPCIVLSNSLGTDLSMWDPQAAALARDHHVVRYDTRGHGRSTLGTAPVTLERLGRDVVGLLDALAIPRARFCGISMGGLTGQWLGIHAPQRFDGLVLANTAPRIGTAEGWHARAAQVRREGMDGVADGAATRWFTADFIAREPYVVKRMIGRLREQPPAGYAACCDALAEADLRAALGAIAVPTLIVAGAADPVTTVADAMWMRERIRGATVLSLAASHLSNIEAEASFTSAVQAFRAD